MVKCRLTFRYTLKRTPMLYLHFWVQNLIFQGCIKLVSKILILNNQDFEYIYIYICPSIFFAACNMFNVLPGGPNMQSSMDHRKGLSSMSSLGCAVAWCPRKPGNSWESGSDLGYIHYHILLIERNPQQPPGMSKIP